MCVSIGVAVTQIIGLVSRHWTFQVSDRLLTQKLPNSVKTFHENSNKTVIYRATDAHVVVGYAGAAYLDATPTDHFIARSLLGISLPERGIVAVGRPDSWTDLGQSTKRLLQDVSAALDRIARRDGCSPHLEISILGWRQQLAGKRRIAPVAWSLESREGLHPTLSRKTHRLTQNWFTGYLAFATPAMPIERLKAEISRVQAPSPEDLKRVLVEELRRRSVDHSAFIGKDCLLVTLPPTKPLSALVRYVRSDCQAVAQDVSLGAVAYSPWIIAPPMAWSPAVIGGGAGGFQSADYSWQMEGLTPPPGPLRVSHESQLRPPDPAR